MQATMQCKKSSSGRSRKTYKMLTCTCVDLLSDEQWQISVVIFLPLYSRCPDPGAVAERV